MRAIFIALGETAMAMFHPVLLGFAGILLFSSYKLISEGESDAADDLSENWIVSLASETLDATDSYDGDNFFTSVRLKHERFVAALQSSPSNYCVLASTKN